MPSGAAFGGPQRGGRRRVCIVSSRSLCMGPRVVKEADALADAGYSVHVVVCHVEPHEPDWDAELAATRVWSYSAVPWDRAHRRKPLGALLKTIAITAPRASVLLGPRSQLGAASLLHAGAPVGWAARKQDADLFIAHNLPALAPTALVARLKGAALGFDAEDDHVGEFPDSERSGVQAQLFDAVQAHALPQCAHVTAASAGIAETLAARYGIQTPTPIHNVFPWSDRASIDGARLQRRGDDLSLYWFSQHLGLDRGLQDLLRAAGLLRGRFQIHLQGHAGDSVRHELMTLARSAGVAERVHIHAPVPPAALLSRCAEHDIGLALEQPLSENRRNTVTNKLFLYLLAGLAAVCTDTPGQLRVIESMPDAATPYRAGDYHRLADVLQRHLDDPAGLARAKSAALEAARTRWCWEREAQRLVDALGRCFRAD